MTQSASDIDAKINAGIASRVGALRALPRAALANLPPELTEYESIGDVRVEFTTFVEPYPDGRLIVLVRSDRRLLFDFVRGGNTDGFWVHPDGRTEAASWRDILDHFG